MRFSPILSLFTFSALATAHSMHETRAPTLEDLVHEEIRAREHAVMARNCEPEIKAHVAMRKRRRAEIQKREAGAAGGFTHIARAHYDSIQNTTCLTSPEVTEGPYYVNNELVRSDIRESQGGVTLLMDFGVMDTTTCTAMNNTLVEIWHANATGEYGTYVTNTFNGMETWLRGGWYTDVNGMTEITTVHPGYYTGRAPHIHIMVHSNWSQSTNGSLISHSGTVVHVGQAFFNESWNDEVFNTSPYTSNTNERTLNSDDSILNSALQNGYSAYTALEYLNGNDLSQGLVGYLTLGVDPRATYSINNKNYNQNSTGSSGNTSGSTDGSGSNNGATNAAESQWRGWGNTLGLSLLAFAYFGYRHAPSRVL